MQTQDDVFSTSDTVRGNEAESWNLITVERIKKKRVVRINMDLLALCVNPESLSVCPDYCMTINCADLGIKSDLVG